MGTVELRGYEPGMEPGMELVLGSPGLLDPAAPPRDLSMRAVGLAHAALAPRTCVLYRSALAGLDRWLAGRPVTDALVAEYCAERHEAGWAPSTVALVVAAVRCMARLSDRPAPVGRRTRRVLAGIRRAGCVRGYGQVAGITWPMADAICTRAAGDGGSLIGLRDAAMIALMSDALLRISEVRTVAVQDLHQEGDGSGRLGLVRSKTDQEGKGVVLYVGAPTMGRIVAFLQAGGVVSGPVFRRIRRGDHVQATGLSMSNIRRIIQERAVAAGIRGRVSGHSLRVGAAQSLAAAGCGVVEMQVAGRWRSPQMPGHYARNQLAAHSAVARLRYGTPYPRSPATPHSPYHPIT